MSAARSTASRVARRVAIAIAVVLALGAAGLVCQRVADRGRFAVPYSTFGSGPEGARALHLLVQRLGRPSVRWAEDLGRLPDGGVLVMLGGCEHERLRPLTRLEKEALARWIDAGGVLVVAGAADVIAKEHGVWLEREPGACDPVEGVLGVLARTRRSVDQDGGVPEEVDRLAESFEDDPRGTLDALAGEDPAPTAEWASPVANAAFDGVGAIPMRQPAEVRTAEGAAPEILLELPKGPGAVAVRRGRGAIIAIASASMLQNRELAVAGGAAVFARLLAEFAPDGPVLFDEYHLGVGARRSLSRYLRQIGAAPLALQVLVVIAFVIWRVGARFGAPVRRLAPPPAGTASYVAAIGALYEKSGDAASAAAILVRHALHRIAAHHHVAAGDAEGIAKALDDKRRHDEARAVRRLADLAREASPRKKADLVQRAKEIDRLVEQATTSPTEERQ